jgi:putative transposase
VKAHQAVYPIATMCRVLEVSTSGYYAWRKRVPSARAHKDAILGAKIVELHKLSREIYGAPKLHADLRELGIGVGRKRVARIMQRLGIKGVCRQKGCTTTWRNKDARPAPDLVERNFSATGPDQLWVADITYVPTWAGFLFVAVVLDAWSRRIVGWSMATNLRTQLVVDALNMALARRKPRAVIHHSDQGCQYTSIDFGLRCKAAGVRPSMGSVGDAYDNAMCESFFASLECELLDRTRFRNQHEAQLAVFDYIEGFYNSYRRHESLCYLSPNTFERRMIDAA